MQSTIGRELCTISRNYKSRWASCQGYKRQQKGYKNYSSISDNNSRAKGVAAVNTLKIQL